jgi:broad specificity phosphatase PhoE
LQNTIYYDLHENDRTGFSYLPMAEFEQTILEFFTKPDDLIMGKETARQAQQRFAKQIDNLDTRLTTAVIAHGTVNSLFTALHNDIDVMGFWKRLQLPSYIVLEINDFHWDGKIHNHP